MEPNKLDDASYVRRLLSFTCFAVSSFPELSKKRKMIWNFETVREGFTSWTYGRNRKIIEISEAIENIQPGSDDFVWYRINANRYAGILLLYSIIGFYRIKEGKRDKHADLIIELLRHISEGVYPDEKIFNEINLTYYWNKETMGYYEKALSLKEMSNADFSKLPKQNKWLNS